MRKAVLPTLSLIVIFLVLGAMAVFYFSVLGRANPTLRKTEVTIGTHTFDVEVASSTIEQARGLSGRNGLGENQGMFFPFATAGIKNFWMKDMRFPIDMIWIGGGKVLDFAENAQVPAPGTALWNLKIYNSPDGTDGVLEVTAGTVAKEGIKAGDVVLIVYPQ